MVRGGFQFIDESNGDYRLRISNARLHKICYTSDVSSFIKAQQFNYATHIIRMSPERSTKLLMFNDDKYSKRGRPVKSLIDQAIGNENILIDEICNIALSN